MPPLHLLPDAHPAAGSARLTLPAAALTAVSGHVGGGLRVTVCESSDAGGADPDARRPGDEPSAYFLGVGVWGGKALFVPAPPAR